jgi:hypothetical protein
VDRTIGINDGILAAAQDDAEQLVVTTLDHDLLVASRVNPEAPGLGLRRLDLYDALYAEQRPARWAAAQTLELERNR